MTGAYVRIFRGGKWQSVEFDQLTDDEMDAFSEQLPGDGWMWAKFFGKWIRDNVREGEQWRRGLQIRKSGAIAL